MAVTDTWLISIEEARRYVFRNEDDTSRDGILADAISDVSDSIVDHCKREFVSATASTTLATTMNTIVTTVVLTSATGFPTVNGGKIRIDDEVMLVTAGAGTTTLTVTRAQDDTVAATHTSGATVGELEARVFEYAGAGTLDLAPYDLRDLAHVVLYTDLEAGSHVQLTTAQYRLEPRGRARGDTYLALTLPYPSMVETDYGFGWQVTVTGTWGMEAVPGSVKLACKQWVDNIVKNPGSFASQSMSGYTVIPEQDESARRAGMPPSVRHRLEGWRRKTHSGMSVVRFGHAGMAAPGIPHTLPTV